jgi:GNAT superfamily N-acetyltransferase
VSAGTAVYTVREARLSDLDGARALMLRVLDEDLGYGFVPALHADIADLKGTYLNTARHVLLVAVASSTGAVIGTAGVRAGGPKTEYVPPWLAARYDPTTTAQIVRVFIAPEYRRLGVARRLVEAARRWVQAEGGYTTICLHTDLPFWRSLADEVYDARGRDEWETVHFEVPLPPGEAR